MNALGSISTVPARQYMAASRIEAKGLDQLIKDPASALRRLGEQSLTGASGKVGRTQSEPSIAVTTDRSLIATLARNAIEEISPVTGKSQYPSGLDETTGEEKAAQESKKTAPGDLSPDQERAVQELRARDREVRAHEQAHKIVGGKYAGAISYSYQEGPDGKQYAIGGSVPIDVSPESTPEATVAKMRVVIAAALAPAEPSGPDRAVAQTAQAQLMQASADARAEKQAEAAQVFEKSTGTDDQASAVAGMLAASASESPYKALENLDFNAAGQRQVDDAA